MSDLDDMAKRATLQVGFITNVVSPLWHQVVRLFPQLEVRAPPPQSRRPPALSRRPRRSEWCAWSRTGCATSSS